MFFFKFSTLEHKLDEVAKTPRPSTALDKRGCVASCDSCDAPLTPASLAGIDHKDLEQRTLTRSVTRATVYDDPPEK